MIDSENLRTASLYINNQLLSRGLLRDGQNIDFANPERGSGGLDATMGKVMSVVNDLILRRDVRHLSIIPFPLPFLPFLFLSSPPIFSPFSTNQNMKKGETPLPTIPPKKTTKLTTNPKNPARRLSPRIPLRDPTHAPGGAAAAGGGPGAASRGAGEGAGVARRVGGVGAGAARAAEGGGARGPEDPRGGAAGARPRGPDPGGVRAGRAEAGPRHRGPEEGRRRRRPRARPGPGHQLRHRR